jgi:hypothetical protein
MVCEKRLQKSTDTENVKTNVKIKLHSYTMSKQVNGRNLKILLGHMILNA